MSTLTKIAPTDAAAKIASGELVLVDVREPDEFVREHATGARSVPLSSISAGTAELKGTKHTVFMCRSGNRTDVHCSTLFDAVDGKGYVLEGGLQGWITAGLPMETNKAAPLEIMRQVQIAAGGLTLAGVVLGFSVHPGFFGLSGFVGAGLLFAGLSGFCGMATLLRVMPWNRTQAA